MRERNTDIQSSWLGRPYILRGSHRICGAVEEQVARNDNEDVILENLAEIKLFKEN